MHSDPEELKQCLKRAVAMEDAASNTNVLLQVGASLYHALHGEVGWSTPFTSRCEGCLGPYSTRNTPRLVELCSDPAPHELRVEEGLGLACLGRLANSMQPHMRGQQANVLLQAGAGMDRCCSRARQRTEWDVFGTMLSAHAPERRKASWARCMHPPCCYSAAAPSLCPIPQVTRVLRQMLTTTSADATPQGEEAQRVLGFFINR